MPNPINEERAVLGDHDTVFEDEVDIVADSFHASIIFRLPAPTSRYHGFALEVNPQGKRERF
jgi:hypothetical protein